MQRVLKSIVKWAAAMAVGVGASGAMAYTAIDTNPSWDGVQFINSFGNPNTATYGQIITVPAGESVLTSFSFQINDQGTAFPMQAEVYAWDSVNSRATGAARYESAPVNTAGVNAFRRFTFNPNVALTAGQQYVIFATTSRNQTPPNTGARWGSVVNTAYAGGQFVYINNGTDTTQWTGNAWSTIASDLAFTATFGTPVVPALDPSMLLLLAGLLAVGGFVIVRRRA